MSASGSERTGVIVVGAGGGRRLGGVEKAFLHVAGAPLIAHSVGLFQSLPEIDEICLVVAAPSVDRARALVATSNWTKVTAVVPGGAERQDSVRAGLDALAGCEWILVHDAARPLVTPEIVRAGLAAARVTGASVAATQVRDTLKRASGDTVPRVMDTVDRAALWAAQTPQTFRASVLRDAFAKLGTDAAQFTDDAALVQAAGYDVAISLGDVANLKLTLAEDVPLVEALLRSRSNAVNASETVQTRTGTGYDVHRLEAGRRLILGGVEIPFERGLAGHSDADALAHAVIDALFGACGLPDIGRHFPPSDPRYAGADSIALLVEATRLALEAGWAPVSVDSTVICERPKLAPHIEGMRARLAEALGLSPDAVNVKAKTNEGLDAVGRGEAVATHAIITIKRTHA
jgi:2-C-methyl-D-erythritol 4-phosphate cytidylyltransferase / 2-C-methyl-D-erythritol 2,4-cyclodiphosphate synthase